MPDVADYRVISDGSVTLQTGGDIDHTFNFDLGTAVKLCIREKREQPELPFLDQRHSSTYD